MSTINIIKELAEADTPLLFFQCRLADGSYQCFSTQNMWFNGQSYSPRVLKHDLFDFQLSSDDAMDSIASLSLTLANADSFLSEIGASIGWKGAQLTVYFAFADLASGITTTESTILFRGVAGDPDQIDEDSLQLTFSNKLSLLRIGLPETRIQRLCPWTFPSSAGQRSQALNAGIYSKFYRCGYSADIPGGFGNLDNGQAFTSCDHTRTSCQARGMFSQDTKGTITARYGGFEFIPSSILVRGYGEKTSHLSAVLDPAAKYNDYVPMVYGTGWLKAPVIFARNDGNFTHVEALLGSGPIDSVLKVVVNGIEIPRSVTGADMTATGWFNLITPGNTQGAFNLDFSDSNSQPLGDPHGSIAVLSVIVPNRISSGSSAPNTEVLLQGLHLDRFNLDGSFRDNVFTNNPAWIIVDILRRAGWSLPELNLPVIAQTAAFCDELIATTDLNGKPIQVPRFHCNLLLTKRKSAAEVIRGIRVACGLMLRYGVNGLLELLPETTLALQQPSFPDGSNARDLLNGGWPAYEFSDGSSNGSGIARDSAGRSTVKLVSRGMSELSNRLSAEFQDESNEYQQDSLSVVNDNDQVLIGYEMASLSTALGIPNFNQAYRILNRQLNKLSEGNQFVEFETSFRALKLRPGDIFSFTYLKEGLVRVAFRVIKLTPSVNYRRVSILGQLHDDTWYSDDPNSGGASGRQPGAGMSLPRPLLGNSFGSDGSTEFGIQEESTANTDGGAATTLRVSFAEPARPSASTSNLPLLSLSPETLPTGGALPGGNYYYAISAVDAAGNESMLSFTVAATLAPGTTTNVVTLTNLSLPPSAASFNVYRGTNPQLMYRIASSQPVADTFSDDGRAAQPVGPPDANFQHANFYYRLELAGPLLCTSSSASTIGNSDMNATKLVYSGMTVRLIAGTGAGQERKIVTNDATVLTVSPVWSIVPDSTTTFVIAESSWRFGALSKSSPVEFQVPNQMGTVVEVSGRGANVNNQEGATELCPVTRWVVGGNPGSQLDNDVSGAPGYVLNATGQGNLTLSQVSFHSLTNTRSVTAGTLQVFCFDELQAPSPYQLTAGLDLTSTTVSLNSGRSALPGQAIQIGTELMTVLSANPAANTCTVIRGQLGSTSSTHSAQDPVLWLNSKTFVVPFARDFFENPASQNFAHTINLPDARVAASELFVSNSRGDSPSAVQCYSGTPDTGLRTCSGGQLSIQVGGYLAVQQNAAPPLLVEAAHAPRDIRASVTEAPSTDVLLQLLQNGIPYCSLTIAAGNFVSNIFDGKTLPPLQSGATLRLDVVQVGQASQGAPGRDLTVTVRF